MFLERTETKVALQNLPVGLQNLAFDSIRAMKADSDSEPGENCSRCRQNKQQGLMALYGIEA